MKLKLTALGILLLASFIGNNCHAFQVFYDNGHEAQYRFEQYEFTSGYGNNVDITSILRNNGINTRNIKLEWVKLVVQGNVHARFQVRDIGGNSQQFVRRYIDVNYCHNQDDYYYQGRYYIPQFDYDSYDRDRCYISIRRQTSGGRTRDIGTLAASPSNRIFFANGANTVNKQWSVILSNLHQVGSMHVTISR